MAYLADQATRHMAVNTPFGENKLILKSLHGEEALSRLFEYRLEMLSEEDSLEAEKIVGQAVAIRIDQDERADRFLHGFVREFQHGGWSDQFTTYRAIVVPWLWFLTQRQDCRIFQEKSTPEIVEEVFKHLGFQDYELQLRGTYPPREYCVQYRESDFDFVSRLMEEEGIFYYFTHDSGGHKLIVGDEPSAYFELDPHRVELAPPEHTAGILDQIQEWEHGYSYRPGAYSQTDYEFKTPSKNLAADEKSIVKLANNKALEIYDYHGRHFNESRGSQLAKVRMQEIEAEYDIAQGEGTYRSFSTGGKFQFKNHRVEAEVGREYVLTKLEIYASVGGSYVTGTGDNSFEFRNRFTAIPAETVFRPKRVTPQPIVEGPQTAVIVGPPGEEIFPDEYGRVKCQFHWDRLGNYDDKSSCWIRVSQAHAGRGWGGIDLPRIREEVIVDFLEGDPDAPIITGRVYNAENKPPFALPAGMTRSGMKSDTHKGSGNNEISMDDTAGAEQLRTNAQFNMDTTVGNNQTLIVGVDRTEEIGNNDTLTVGNDKAESVGNNKDVTVGNSKNVDVGNKLVFNAGSSITLKCGASRIHMNSGGVITISGTIITTAAAANASVVAPMTQVVGGAMLTTFGGVNMMTGGVTAVKALGLASVSGSKVDVAASGTTKIKGATITLN